MTKIPTGYNLPDGLNSDMSDQEIKEKLLSGFKQEDVKKSNFPTEVVPLPSKGMIYPTGHPLADGFIEMKYMTAKEEDILTSQNLIKQGVVLDKLFESLIVTPVNYGDIYSGDKNAIMVAARLLGYGNDYTVEIDDPFSPGTKQKVTIDLSQIEHKEVDYSLFENRKNEFDFELPNSKRVVTFRLMTHALEKQIETEIKASNKTIIKTGIDRELTTRLKHIIIAVDGESGRSNINNFVDNELFAVDSRALRSYMKQISPDLDMSFTFISDATGEVKELDIPMDVSFFWPNS
jgi:hypothetical protein